MPLRALRRTDLVIERGEFVSIVGASGSGKTTLLNLLGLLDRPSSGEYFVDGAATTRLSERMRTSLRARYFGFVFQAFHLLSDRSAIDNVAMGVLYRGTEYRERSRLALAALAQVGLEGLTNALPGSMSGGEQQRTAIARALIGRPPVLLCDEPTGNLDQKTAQAILDLLRALHAEGLTMVIVTHDPAVAQQAGRQLRVVDGLVFE